MIKDLDIQASKPSSSICLCLFVLATYLAHDALRLPAVRKHRNQDIATPRRKRRHCVFLIIRSIEIKYTFVPMLKLHENENNIDLE